MNKVEDVLAVEQLLARYIDAVFRKDMETFRPCWAEDGRWKIFGNEMHGRDAICQLWLGLMGDLDYAWQEGVNKIFDLGATTGTGRVYITEIASMKSGLTLLSRGVYHDQYVKTDGGWRFASRHFDLIHSQRIAKEGRDFAVPHYANGTQHPAPDNAAVPGQDDFGAWLATL